jgi:hypothetical protein
MRIDGPSGETQTLGGDLSGKQLRVFFSIECLVKRSYRRERLSDRIV